jgi:hypothetical protein
MASNDSNVTIRFPRIGLEIRPYTIDFRVDRNQFDYLDAKFSKEVGEYIKPYMDKEGDILRSPQPVEVVMDGEVSHRLYFRPQYVTHGETNCWIELHDPEKHLKYEVVDYSIDDTTAKEAYKRVVEEANTEDIIKDVDFKIPSDAQSHLDTESVIEGPGGIPITLQTFPVEKGVEYADKITALWTDYDEEADRTPSQTIVDSVYNFDIENKTALEAIYWLNDKLGLQSSVDNNGVLTIGLDFFEPTHHVASANDSRVWRYNDVELTEPGTPIKMAVVNGGLIDAPNSTQEENGVESVLEFANPSDDHEGDLIAQGVAQQKGVLDGKIVSMDAPNISRDGLKKRAQQVLANEVSNNNSGSLNINPDTSGTEITDWRNLNVGDFLQVIPNSDADRQEIERQVLLISGIQHQVDGGSWNIELTVQKWQKVEAETTMRYFSPDSNSYYNSDFEEIYAESE